MQALACLLLIFAATNFVPDAFVEIAGRVFYTRPFGAFVYRLGREVLNLERGVQLP